MMAGRSSIKRIIAIMGPTAVGKTALALKLARHFDTAIISADSRQCFRELNIGVAKPRAAELEEIPHYFINSHSIHEEVHAGLFENLALGWAEELFKIHDTIILSGGTGLYGKAFFEGLDNIPSIDFSFREQIQNEYNQNGLGWLQEKIRVLDPLFYEQGEMQNPQRLMRALEIKSATGKSIFEFREGGKKKRGFDIIRIGLEIPKQLLHTRINTRVDEMIASGLEEEVKSLWDSRNLNALRTVGYTELFHWLEGGLDKQTAIELIKRNTRQYAKRQITWFRKDPSMQWIHPEDEAAIQKLMES
jgi:tRNA dimethylallyltransferase